MLNYLDDASLARLARVDKTHNKHDTRLMNRLARTADTMQGLAREGQLETLKWLRAQDPPCPWNEHTCLYAAQGGQLETLRWRRCQVPPCAWDKYTCRYATRGGHLEVLKWLRVQDPPCGVHACRLKLSTG